MASQGNSGFFDDSDIEKILSEEKEQGWTLVLRNEKVEVWKKHDDDSPVNAIKVRTFTLKSASLSDIYLYCILSFWPN